MKKYLLTLFLLVFIIPSVAFASWWNPFSWFQKNIQPVGQTTIQVSNDNIPVAESKVQEKKATVVNTNNIQSPIKPSMSPIVEKTVQAQIVEPVKVIQSPIIIPTQKSSLGLEPAHVLSFNSTYTSSVNYNNFKKISSLSYSKNYGAYLNKQIEITSLVINNFIPTDSGGYIDTIGSSNSVSNQDEIMVEVNNTNDYQEILNTLNNGDTIIVYGLGVPNKKIDQVNSYRIASLNYPAIAVQRIDKCQSSCSTIFSKTIPQDQGVKSGIYEKISLQDALKDAALYTSTNFTTQGSVKDFMPYDNKGNYAVGIKDPNNLDSFATVLVDANSKNQLEVGSLIEVSGHFKYIGSQILNIDTVGSPIKIIRY